MPDPFNESFNNAPRPDGPYLDHLDDEDRCVYEATTGDLNLGEEIRLMRAVLAHLSADIPGNHKAMSAILNSLVRAVYIQAKELAGSSDVEQALLDAAEMVLQGAGGGEGDSQEMEMGPAGDVEGDL